MLLLTFHAYLPAAVADTGDVLLSPAVKRTLSPADVVAAIGQLGDNTLAPADINMHDLALDQGRLNAQGLWPILGLLGQ